MRPLLVEDDVDLASRLSRRLTTAGFAVDRAADGTSALAWPDLDNHRAVILDMGLPGLDGMSVLRGWRSGGLRVPVIILTARGNWQEKVEGLNAGANDFVVKPVHSEELIARLHAQIRHQHTPVQRVANSAAMPAYARRPSDRAYLLHAAVVGRCEGCGMSSRTSELLLTSHLKTLKLPTFLREHDKLARQCAAATLPNASVSWPNTARRCRSIWRA
tara:strand:+ start:92 stop:742 length:651 start_codon:yes stop_codon:yes gene_type:complete